MKINPLIRFSAIYFEGDFYIKNRDGVKSHLDSFETTKSITYAIIRKEQREEFRPMIGNVHYALAKYDKVNRVTIPLGKDGLIMFSTEPEAECELIAHKVIEFKKKNEISINA